MSDLSLGEYLRTEREKRGLTVEQVASATKISIRLLHALEADHYSDLPAKPFIRGFVNSYCRFIGLDAKDTLTRYARYLEEQAKTDEKTEDRYSGYAFDRRDLERSKTILWSVMGAFVIVGGLFIFVLKPALRHRKVTPKVAELAASTQKKSSQEAAPAEKKVVATEKEDSKKQPSEDKQATEVAQAKPVDEDEAEERKKQQAAESKEEERKQREVAKSKEEEDKDPDPLHKGDSLEPDDIRHKVVFKALADIWVRYKVDDRQMMKFILRKGRYLVLKGENSVQFQASNPRSILVRYGASGYQLFEKYKDRKVIDDVSTLYFPPTEMDPTSPPFSGLVKLDATPDPTEEEEASAAE